MKMKKIIRNTAVVLALCAASCTGLYDNLNTDPNSATPEHMQADYLLYGSLIIQMQRDLIPTSDETANEFQRAQNLTGDIFGGYMAAIGTWGGGSNGSTYNLYTDDWYDVAFTVAYANTMSPWITLKENAEANGDDAPLALANILKVGSMHRLTDMYGPLPYTKFGQGGFETPYDSQEAIYNEFFKELDWAIEVLEAFPDPALLARYDIFFGGEVAKWLRYANSLKLRLAVRMAYVNPELAAQYAKEAVESGVMESNADNATIKSHGSVIVYNPLKVVWDDYGDTRMNATMDSYLNGYADPRRTVYFRPATRSTNTTGAVWGVRGGQAFSSKNANALLMSVPNVEANAPVKVMSAAESWFLRAEGAIRGWEGMGGTAKELYEQGITVSFQECGSTMGNYLSNSTATPIAFTSNYGSGGVSTPPSNITIAWNESATFEQKLERIITQKWIAGFPEGQEAWSEFRRTGYPKLFPVMTNNSGSTIDTDIQIRRVIYPRAEYQQNAAGVAGGVALLGGTGDNGGVRLWWDAKN